MECSFSPQAWTPGHRVAAGCGLYVPQGRAGEAAAAAAAGRSLSVHCCVPACPSQTISPTLCMIIIYARMLLIWLIESVSGGSRGAVRLER